MHLTPPPSDDGTYTHASEPAIKILDDLQLYKDENVDSAIKNMHFAQLVNIINVDKGGERDELIHIVEETVKGSGLATVAIKYKLNDNGNFNGPWVGIDVKMDCKNRGIRWGDVNGYVFRRFLFLLVTDTTAEMDSTISFVFRIPQETCSFH
jgi:hypothetical protein